MKNALRAVLAMSAGLALLGIITGCGSPSAPPSDPDKQAAAKVAAMKRLADEMAKDPEGVEARGALEEFRITSMELQKHPNEANEILEIYRTRIQGKYKGFVAQEIAGEMGQFHAFKKGK